MRIPDPVTAGRAAAHRPGLRTVARPWRRFVAIGDSFTEGLMDEVGPDGRHRGWADRVADRLAERVPDFAYANLAIRGRLVAQVWREQVPAARGMQPDLVSFAAGVNDSLRRGFDLDASCTAVEAGVRELRGCGADVLLFAFGDPARRSSIMGTVRERISAYNRAIRAIAEHHGCYLVDFWDVAVFDEDAYWDEDRLHLSPQGHALAASCALQALGVGDDAWRTPHPIDPVPLSARARSNARWARSYLAPWVVRRIQGRSSGDDIVAKRPQPRAWPAR